MNLLSEKMKEKTAEQSGFVADTSDGAKDKLVARRRIMGRGPDQNVERDVHVFEHWRVVQNDMG
jgi:hypothetical protein